MVLRPWVDLTLSGRLLDEYGTMLAHGVRATANACPRYCIVYGHSSRHTRDYFGLSDPIGLITFYASNKGY